MVSAITYFDSVITVHHIVLSVLMSSSPMFEKIPGIPPNTQEFLLLHPLEHPDEEHRCLVRKQDCKALERVVHSAKHTLNVALSCPKNIYTIVCKNKARRTIKHPNHLVNSIFSLLQLRGRCEYTRPPLRVSRRLMPSGH